MTPSCKWSISHRSENLPLYPTLSWIGVWVYTTQAKKLVGGQIILDRCSKLLKSCAPNEKSSGASSLECFRFSSTARRWGVTLYDGGMVEWRNGMAERRNYGIHGITTERADQRSRKHNSLFQCSYRSRKIWKVMKFNNFIFQAWKVTEFHCRSWKIIVIFGQ